MGLLYFCLFSTISYENQFSTELLLQNAEDDSPISEYELWKMQENEFNSLLEQMKNPCVAACCGKFVHSVNLVYNIFFTIFFYFLRKSKQFIIFPFFYFSLCFCYICSFISFHYLLLLTQMKSIIFSLSFFCVCTFIRSNSRIAAKAQFKCFVGLTAARGNSFVKI